MPASSLSVAFSWLPVLTTALTATGALDNAVQKAAEQTCAKTGAEYKPVYDASGMPMKCEAPPRSMCFFGAYTDPKTGREGCCGRGNGEVSTDPLHPKEGACCVSPKIFSYDATSNKGSCCAAGQTYSVDATTGVGGCCASPLTYQCQCSARASSAGMDNSGGSDTQKPITDDTQSPSNAPTKCPDAHGWTFTQDGVDYMIDCHKGWNQKLGQGKWTKAADIWECLKNCGAEGPTCQGVNYWAQTQDCGFALNWEYPATGDGDPDLMAAIPLKQKA